MKKVALISVYHKKGIEAFAGELVKLNWEILSSGGTAEYLKEHGIASRDVADLVGGEAILGHRVVTLSREVHAGLLSRNIEEDITEMKSLGLPRIDLVCCDFYPLAAEITNQNHTIESVVEKTDIGGPTMVRSGAKGYRIVICDPVDRDGVIKQLKDRGYVDNEMRQYLRAKAEAVVANYCLDSARFHSFGKFDGMTGWVVRELAYGENRDQSPAYLYSTGTDDPLAWDNFKIISGNPGYINMADGDRALQVLCLMAESFRVTYKRVPYIAIACKHGNACGAAFDWERPEKAMLKALLGDPLAVMGAEVMTNFRITEKVGQVLYEVPARHFKRAGRKKWGVDVIFAPGFNPEASELLTQRKTRRLLVNPALKKPVIPSSKWVHRPVRGGFIKQKAPNFVLNLSKTEEVEKQTCKFIVAFDAGTLILAWAVAWRADSNSVILAKNGMLISSGVGQMDRLACCKLALGYAERAGHNTKGSIFASDAFFPFAKRAGEEYPLEGTELLAQAGCRAGVVPADG
ncbi:hypothetical protein KA005_60755, partial [bacterium]|nr:hypothetical protein [bacterium]